jgi:hypothetical protein
VLGLASAILVPAIQSFLTGEPAGDEEPLPSP